MIILLRAFVFIFFVSCMLYGQSSGSVSGSASANLIVPLSITTASGGLDFGQIISTSSANLETILPQQGQQFIVNGQPGINVTINFSNTTLSNAQWVSLFGGASGSLNFIPLIETNTGVKVASGTSHPLQYNGAWGELILMVGGSISIPANQPHGDYTGVFVMTVSY